MIWGNGAQKIIYISGVFEQGTYGMGSEKAISIFPWVAAPSKGNDKHLLSATN